MTVSPRVPITFDFPSLNPGEALVLDNYVEETFGNNEPVLRVGDDGETGTITFAFTGRSDIYDVEVTYFDEEGGEGSLLSVGGRFGSGDTATIVIGDNDLSPSVIPGTAASEVLDGTEGDDIISGEAGDDVLKGFGGDDILNGGAGRNLISGDAGNDEVSGGAARDFLNGNDDDDVLNGGAARDVLNGGEGDDQLNGGAGRDVLEGNKGDDLIFGGQGADLIRGNKGADTLRGGDGRDNLRGGAGADIYVTERARGFDIFEGFQRGIDQIRLASGLSFADLDLQVQGSDTVIRVAATSERLAIVLDTDVTEASNFTGGGTVQG